MCAGKVVPPGGPSTINGILYQMLWCALRTLSIRLSGVAIDNSLQITAATLILEPRQGGDLRELSGPRQRVVQLKTRSGGRTWSLKEVVEDVLPDMYRAVDLSIDDVAFEFVTEGRIGAWQRPYSFFKSLLTRPPGSDPLSSLDSHTEMLFGRHYQSSGTDTSKPYWELDRYTELSLFEHIVSRLGTHFDEPIEQTRLKVWHLLSRFNFVGDRAKLAIQREVDSLLLALVSHPTQVVQKREALLGDLMERAACGDAEVRTDDLLRSHGLSVVSLTEWTSIRSRAVATLRRSLEIHQYDNELDVRPVDPDDVEHRWPSSCPLLALSGESGIGKSWEVFAWAYHLATEPGLVVVLDATGSAQQDLAEAASLVWQEFRGQETSPTLSQIAAHVKAVAPNLPDPWLTILIDAVQDPEEARQLALKPIEDWGVRLAITAAPNIAKAFHVAAGSHRARIELVDLFSAKERDRLLESRLGDAWLGIPADVRDTLRRPLLASIYCRDLRESATWLSANEYELYTRFWDALSSGPYAKPLDATCLAQLSASLFHGALYPWTGSQLLSLRIDNQTTNRLIRGGWLLSMPGDRFAIVHDRLLNFAVAQGLVLQLREGELTLDSLGERLAGLFAPAALVAGGRLGYVPMDVLHLVLADASLGAESCSGLVSALAEVLPHEYTQELYSSLLPTLGVRVAHVLFKQLEIVARASPHYSLAAVIEGINRLASPDVQLFTRQLLDSDHPRCQRAALRILAKVPDAAVLDRIWNVHCLAQDTPDKYDSHAGTRALLYRESFAALQECSRLAPAWLERKITTAEMGESHISDLGYLVALLDDEGRTWRATKGALITKLPVTTSRALINNIKRWRDAEEIPRLKQLASRSDNWIAPTALAALVRLDPDEALTGMALLSDLDLGGFRSWYLGELLETRPEQTRRVLNRRIADNASGALVYVGFEDAIDPPTLALIANHVTTILRMPKEEQRRGDVRLLLSLLAKASSLSALEYFQRGRDSELEWTLVQFLLDTGPRRSLDPEEPERVSALQVLEKIGGMGVDQVVQSYLASDSRYERFVGIRFAHRNPSEETGDLLLDCIQQADRRTGHVVEQAEEQEEAIRALAASGDTRRLVLAFLSPKVSFPEDLTSFVATSRPFDDDSVRPALELLERSGDGQAGAVLAIGVAGRVDACSNILDLLAQSAPDSARAAACVESLGLLRCTDARAVDLLRPLLQVTQQRLSVATALMRIGSDSALRSLVENLRDSYDERIAIALASQRGAVSEIFNVIWGHLAQQPAAVRIWELRRLLAEMRDDEIRILLNNQDGQDLVRDLAFGGEAYDTASVVTSIRALATFDPDAAFRAASHTLRNDQSDNRDALPHLLVQIDPEAAIPVILQQVIEERSSWLAGVMARSVSDLDLEAQLVALLDSADPMQRRAAAVIAAKRIADDGLFDRLGELLNDRDPTVVDAALTALREIRAAREVERMIDAYRDSNGLRRWPLLDAMLSIGDPGDSYAIWPRWAKQVIAIQANGALVLDYLEKSLNKRRKETRRRTDEEDRRRDDQ